MEKSIRPLLDKIFRELNENTSPYPSLYGGETGAALYSYAYSSFINQPDTADLFEAQIQRIAEALVNPGLDPSFCNGRSGINWFFTYLNKKNIIDRDDLELFCHNNNELPDIAIALLKKNNYDFLHGAIGIAYCLLYSNEASDQFYQDFFYHLKLLSAGSAAGRYIPYFDLRSQRPMPDMTNLGLAHGLASILKFCIECYKRDFCREEARSMAEEMIRYFLNHTNKDSRRSYFPSVVKINEVQEAYSRLAWCYGDLSIAYILYQAASAFDDDGLRSFSFDVLLHGTKRRETEETSIYDAGFCHGSAGVAHIYNKAWQLMKEPVFKETRDFWIQRTIDLALHKPDSAIYKKYNPAEDRYEDSFSLLEGSAGIGLVLLSYLTGDLSWDFCFMLND